MSRVITKRDRDIGDDLLMVIMVISHQLMIIGDDIVVAIDIWFMSGDYQKSIWACTTDHHHGLFQAGQLCSRQAFGMGCKGVRVRTCRDGPVWM